MAELGNNSLFVNGAKVDKFIINNEIIRIVLKQASTKGVHRQEIIDILTENQIISKDRKHYFDKLKEVGMYSVSGMSDSTLGTYYQYDGELL